MRLDSGVTIDCDLVLATGVTPQSRLAADAGLQIRDSRIVVSPDMGASAPDVYAASDLALVGMSAGRHLATEHWTRPIRVRSPGPLWRVRARNRMGYLGFGQPSVRRR